LPSFEKLFLRHAGEYLAQRLCVHGGKIEGNIYGDPCWTLSMIGMVDNQLEMGLIVSEKLIVVGENNPGNSEKICSTMLAREDSPDDAGNNGEHNFAGD
jgi:hypothetical protein